MKKLRLTAQHQHLKIKKKEVRIAAHVPNGPALLRIVWQESSSALTAGRGEKR